MSLSRCFLAAAALLCKPIISDAAPTQVSGFATLGVSYTDSNELAFRNDVSDDNGKSKQADFGSLSRIGVQLHKSFNEQWALTGQWVLKRQLDYDLDQLTQLAFINYSPSASWNIKLGRSALDLFMMSPYRNTGYAYTETHAPVEFYGLIPHQSIDGIELASAHATDEGTFSSRWYYGHSSDHLSNLEYQWQLDLEDLTGVTLAFEQHNWLLRLNHSQARIGGKEIGHYPQIRQAAQGITPNDWPQLAALLGNMNPVGSRLRYTTVGARYDSGDYYLQSEFAYIDANSDILTHVINGYLNIGKRWQEYSLQLGYSFTDGKENNIPKAQAPSLLSEALYREIERSYNYYINDQSTLSLSGRYDFRADMAAKLQVEYVDLKRADNQFMLRQQDMTAQDSFLVLSASIDWVF
ncbi:hypothetical protein [Pseudoalteromonas sp. T1lg75]|uniref:hypothetical protein n=1 Tax=Pseudoalteromonas sp. T1lg75 TaxID=2077102 RepID=UPI000CF6FE03|nr:hypothetical protein [Pseudoalteromonas sp. T1lg75]